MSINREKCRKIKYLVVDVDGTLTDAGVYYDDNGNELKKFSTKDGAGFFAAKAVGIKIMVLTGRECPATTRRMTEMKVDYLVQNCRDKVAYLTQFLSDNNISKEEIGYIGDDINDLGSMRLCGFVGCPKDSCKEVLKISDYVSPVDGGHGAMRDVVEHILTERGEWEKAIKDSFGFGI